MKRGFRGLCRYTWASSVQSNLAHARCNVPYLRAFIGLDRKGHSQLFQTRVAVDVSPEAEKFFPSLSQVFLPEQPPQKCHTKK